MATGTGDANLGDVDNSGSASTPFTLEADALLAPRMIGAVRLPGPTLSGSLQGPSELPQFTLSGVALAGSANVGDAFLPAPSVAGAALGGLTAQGALVIPGIELSGSTGTKGAATLPRLTIFATGLAGNTSKRGVRVIAGVTVSETQPTLPQLTLSATLLSQRALVGAVDLDQPTLSATAISGASVVGEVVVRAPTALATGISGTAATGDASVPGLTLAASTADGAAASGSITLPAPSIAATAPAQPLNTTAAGDLTADAATLSATMLPGGLATGASVLREPTLSAFLGNSPPMDGAITVSEFTLAATGLASNAAVGTVRIDEATLAAAAVTGNAGAASVEVPLMRLAAEDGVLDVVGSASLTLPLLSLSALMQGAQLANVTFDSVVLNTRTKAVTQYEGLAPNSLARFGGVTLMATPDGIVALTGDDDQGEPIDAHLTIGKTDFGQAGLKRVITGYVGYRASGDMELTLIADDHHEFSYTLSPRRVEDQQHVTRTKFGRGIAASYWQLKAANVDGADFAIDRIELLTAVTGAKA